MVVPEQPLVQVTEQANPLGQLTEPAHLVPRQMMDQTPSRTHLLLTHADWLSTFAALGMMREQR